MKNKKKSILLLIAIAALLLAAVGGTVAYLVTSTDPVVNTFQPVQVSTDLTEEMEAGVKKNVKIKNTSDIPVYMRVAVIGYWRDDAGNIVAPWTNNITLDEPAKWTPKDGYYYYNGKVAAGATVTLFTEYRAPTAPEAGAHLEMDVIAQVIQAEPTDAVEDAWGYVPGA